MEEITKCLNEWNATIEALGCGKQSILIRKYNTTLNKFLLYPTISYANNEDILESFKTDYKNFAKSNLLPKFENRIFEVKYYAEVDEVIEVPSSKIKDFDKFHIWTNDHVKSYLDRKSAKIWILRIYKLNKPQMLERSYAMIYANVDKPVKLEGKPVIPDYEFNKLKEEIINTK